MGKLLTTQEAAELLNVSQTYLEGLLNKGEIEHRMVGAQHRVELSDLLKYKQNIQHKRKKVLDELVQYSQRHSSDYD